MLIESLAGAAALAAIAALFIVLRQAADIQRLQIGRAHV